MAGAADPDGEIDRPVANQALIALGVGLDRGEVVSHNGWLVRRESCCELRQPGGYGGVIVTPRNLALSGGLATDDGLYRG